MGAALKIAVTGVVFCILIVIVRQQKSEIAVVLSVGAGLVLLFLIVDYVREIFFVLTGLVEKTGIESTFLTALFKIVGTGYICEFAAGLCEDYGCKSLGDKISLGGKVVILALTLPVLTRIVELVVSLMQTGGLGS